MARMMDRLRQRHAHETGGGDGAVEPRELHHLDDGAHAAPLLAQAPRKGLIELDLGRRVGAVAELVLEALETQGVDRAVRAEARHQEAREPACGLSQHQEEVAHRRRHEPLLAGDQIAVAGRLCPRRVGAHVGAALALGHAMLSVMPVFSHHGRKCGS